MFRSNAFYSLAQSIPSTAGAGTTFKFSTDLELGLNLETTGEYISIILRNATQIERMIITATGGIATIIKRGLTQVSVETEDTNLRKKWDDGALITVTALSSDMIDINGTGALTISQGIIFTGDNNFKNVSFNSVIDSGLHPNSLTTTQIGALSIVGTGIVWNSTIGQYQGLIAGAWTTLASGSTQPNASITIAGKIQIATTAQMIAGTNIGNTGALLSGLPSDIVYLIQSGVNAYVADAGANDTYAVNLTPAIGSYITGMRVRIKINTTNIGVCSLNINSLGVQNIKLIDGTDPLDGDLVSGKIYDFVYDGTSFILQGIPVRASSSDASTGTDFLKFITSKQVRDNTFNQSNNGSQNVLAGATSTVIAHGLGVTPKNIDIHAYNDSAGTNFSDSQGYFKLGTQNCAYRNGISPGASSTFCVRSYDLPNTASKTGVISVDATNITITWTTGGAFNVNTVIVWNAVA